VTLRLTHRQDDVLRKLGRSSRRRLTWIHLHDGIGRSRGTVESLERRGLVAVVFLRAEKYVALTGAGLAAAKAASVRWRKAVGL
jgi:hypothetical protein